MASRTLLCHIDVSFALTSLRSIPTTARLCSIKHAVVSEMQDYRSFWKATYNLFSSQKAATVDMPVPIMDPDQ